MQFTEISHSIYSQEKNKKGLREFSATNIGQKQIGIFLSFNCISDSAASMLEYRLEHFST